MRWIINVSNPSSYTRDDYIEVNLQKIGVPSTLTENDLRLFRVESNQDKKEIPFQIDSVLGHDSPVRILSFLSQQTPPGPDDYSHVVAQFELETGLPTEFSTHRSRRTLRIDHYYAEPDHSKGDADDGYNKNWDPDRNVFGIKLHNGQLKFFISLVPHPRAYTAIDYSGAATSIEREGAIGDMLAPFEMVPEKRWGQLNQLSFFPAPWVLEWFKTVSLKEKDYNLVWSHSGDIRSVITMRLADPIQLQYHCSPYFNTPSETILECYLYRIIYVYPDTPYYLEDVLVLTKEGVPIRFRPYFESEVCYPPGVYKKIARFEDIPDYFTAWNVFAGVSRGYGFAADGHIRGFEIGTATNPNIIQWRLPSAYHHRTLNYFMYHGAEWQQFDPYHEIGHTGWYEKIFKPLETFPNEIFSIAKRYLTYSDAA